MIKTVIWFLALLTVFCDVFIIFFVAAFLVEKARLAKWFSLLKKTISPHAFYYSFLVTLVATLGSLFFSEVAKFQPCILCWYQRIMMYPQPLLLYVGIMRNEKIIKPYLMTLSVIGALIALYHYIIQVMPRAITSPCSVEGGVSCVKGYTFYFGYVSIPIMSLTAFLTNLVLLSIWSYAQNRSRTK